MATPSDWRRPGPMSSDLGRGSRIGCARAAAWRGTQGSRGSRFAPLGRIGRYDEIVLACHGDETLALLTRCGPRGTRALGALRYQRNLAILHRDHKRHAAAPAAAGRAGSITPTARRGAGNPVSYWMNRLQGIDEDLSALPDAQSHEGNRRRQIFDRPVEFDHPVFDFAASAGQAALRQMQGRRNVGSAAPIWATAFTRTGWSARCRWPKRWVACAVVPDCGGRQDPARAYRATADSGELPRRRQPESKQ